MCLPPQDYNYCTLSRLIKHNTFLMEPVDRKSKRFSTQWPSPDAVFKTFVNSGKLLFLSRLKFYTNKRWNHSFVLVKSIVICSYCVELSLKCFQQFNWLWPGEIWIPIKMLIKRGYVVQIATMIHKLKVEKYNVKLNSFKFLGVNRG